TAQRRRADGHDRERIADAIAEILRRARRDRTRILFAGDRREELLAAETGRRAAAEKQAAQILHRGANPGLSRLSRRPPSRPSRIARAPRSPAPRIPSAPGLRARCRACPCAP